MAGREREFGYLISADDQASKVFRQVLEEATKSGKSVTDALKDASAAADKLGASEQSVTGFIKEQRVENRMQNFLFRETSGAIGGVTLALGAFGMASHGAGESMKMLSGALNQGMMAFQGISFAFEALGGGVWGKVIGAVVGVVSALATFGDATKKNEDQVADLNLRLTETYYKLGDVSDAMMEEALTAALAAAIKKQIELNKETYTFWDYVKMGLNFLSGHPELNAVIVKSAVGSPEEIANAKQAIATIHTQISEFYDSLVQSRRAMTPEIKAIALDEERFLSAETKSIVDTWIEGMEFMKQSHSKQAAIIEINNQTFVNRLLNQVKKVHVQTFDSFAEVMKSVNAGSQETANAMRQIYQGLTTSIGTMWTDVFTGSEAAGRNFLKNVLLMAIDLVQGLILAASAAAAAKGVLTFGISWALDLPELLLATAGLQLLRAFVASTFHSGGTVPKRGATFFNASPSEEFLVMARGGETFRTEEQEAALGAGATVVVNINAPIDRLDWIKQGVEEGMRRTGLAVDKLFVNQRSAIALGAG